MRVGPKSKFDLNHQFRTRGRWGVREVHFVKMPEVLLRFSVEPEKGTRMRSQLHQHTALCWQIRLVPNVVDVLRLLEGRCRPRQIELRSGIANVEDRDIRRWMAAARSRRPDAYARTMRGRVAASYNRLVHLGHILIRDQRVGEIVEFG